MKIVKIIVAILASILALFLIIGLFVNGNYSVEKEISINKPKQIVFDYIKLLKNQENYSVWASMDSKMLKTYSGNDGTIGFISAWDSKDKNVGKGEQKIIKLDEGERIDYELKFIEPFESTDFAFMETKAVTDSTTKVIWGFNGKMKYPMNITLLFMNMEEMLGNDLNQGLSKLKLVLEKE